MTIPHTQGKLRVGNTAYPSQQLLSDDPASPCVAGGNYASYGATMVAESITPENARRLAACWNALEGVSTEDIEGKDIAEIVASMAYIKGMEGGSLQLQGGALQVLANSFVGQFKGSGAKNYIELTLTDDDLGRYTVTMQRVEGVTPAEQIAALTAQRSELLEALKGLDEAYSRASDHLTSEERKEDRQRLWAARDAVAKVEATADQPIKAAPAPQSATCTHSMHEFVSAPDDHPEGKGGSMCSKCGYWIPF